MNPAAKQLSASVSPSPDYPKMAFLSAIRLIPSKFDKRSSAVIGRSAEVIEINNQIQHVRSELLRHYNLLKKQGSTVTPTMIKNAYLGVHQEKQTLLQVVDFHNGGLLPLRWTGEEQCPGVSKVAGERHMAGYNFQPCTKKTYTALSSTVAAGALLLTEAMPLVLSYISLVPITWPFVAFRLK